jgi:hypothetical protein
MTVAEALETKNPMHNKAASSDSQATRVAWGGEVGSNRLIIVSGSFRFQY